MLSDPENNSFSLGVTRKRALLVHETSTVEVDQLD